jgi:Protein of unknown function (DUF3987)
VAGTTWEEAFETVPEDSWLRDWMRAWEPTEVPRSYLLFSAMAMMGVAIGRRVYMDLDVHRIYPLMNLLLIGPSGIGKSTALRDIALTHLISPMPEAPTKPMVITGKTTKEALHQDLMVNPHSLILASELSNLFSKEKYMEGTIPYVTDLLDLAPARIRTKGSGSQVIDRPECSVMGGSTKEWLQDMMPSTATEGGFLPRFFIVKEDYKYQRIADPNRLLSQRQRVEVSALRDRAFNEFTHILAAADGRYDFEDFEASDAYGYWYNTYLPDTGALAPFAARAGAHVLRLALLSAIARFSNTIALVDINCAIALFSYSQSKLAEVVIPMSPAGKLMAKLLDTIGTEERTIISIRRSMRNHCSGRDVDAMLMDLERNKEVVRTNESYRRTGL